MHFSNEQKDVERWKDIESLTDTITSSYCLYRLQFNHQLTNKVSSRISNGCTSSTLTPRIVIGCFLFNLPVISDKPKIFLIRFSEHTNSIISFMLLSIVYWHFSDKTTTDFSVPKVINIKYNIVQSTFFPIFSFSFFFPGLTSHTWISKNKT